MKASPLMQIRFLGCAALAIGLLWTAAAPIALAAAGTVVLRDNFAQNNDWVPDKGEGKVVFSGGAVSIQALGLKGTEASITRRFFLSPAAAYRVNVQVAVTEQSAEDAVAAILLTAPSGDALTLELSPKDQYIRVTYWRNDKWAESVLTWTGSKAMKAAPGEVNTINVLSEGGRLTISVNGVEAGRTRVIDFAPTSVGLVGQKLKAEFRDLSIVETGVDVRQARQQLLVPVPGQKTLVYDNLQPDAVLLKKLATLGLTASDALPDWPKDSTTSTSSLLRDTTQHALTLQTKTSASLNAFPGNYAPLGDAGVSTHAKLNLVKLVPGADCAGIEIEGQASKQNDPTDSLVGCISQDSAAIHHYDAKTKKWTLLAGDGLALPNSKTAEIRLVWTPQSVVMFVDGRFHASADNPVGFRAKNFGFRIDGGQHVELTEFGVTEI